MPTVPKWLADTLEKVSSKHYHPVAVTHTEYYAADLKLVRFEGDIHQADFVAGNVVEFRVTDTGYRHYTPSSYDALNHVCEVIFYLHGQGPGSAWASSLKPGDRTKLMGPGGKMSYQAAFRRHFVFGDETSLGLMICMERAAREHGHDFRALAELGDTRQEWPAVLGSAAIQVATCSPEDPAGPAIRLFITGALVPDDETDDTCFYLTGRARSIQQFRKMLVARGVANRQIKTYPYWAEGKKGL